MLMINTEVNTANSLPQSKRKGRTWRKLVMNPGAFIGGVVLLVLVFGSLFAPLLAPYDWKATGVGPRLAAPSAEHPFGTDLHGRDVFSRMLYGGRYSLSVGMATVLFSMLVGSLFGIAIANFGGRIDRFGVMAIDVMLGFPPIVLAILIVAVLGRGFVERRGGGGRRGHSQVCEGGQGRYSGHQISTLCRSDAGGRRGPVAGDAAAPFSERLADDYRSGNAQLSERHHFDGLFELFGSRRATPHTRVGRDAQQQPRVHAPRPLDHDFSGFGPVLIGHVGQLVG